LDEKTYFSFWRLAENRVGICFRNCCECNVIPCVIEEITASHKFYLCRNNIRNGGILTKRISGEISGSRGGEYEHDPSETLGYVVW
jgi:hypothetical protein